MRPRMLDVLGMADSFAFGSGDLRGNNLQPVCRAGPGPRLATRRMLARRLQPLAWGVTAWRGQRMVGPTDEYERAERLRVTCAACFACGRALGPRTPVWLASRPVRIDAGICR